MPTLRHQMANLVSASHSLIRFAIMKMLYPKNIYFSLVERFSPSAVVDTDRKSKIQIGRRVSAHSRCRICVNSGGILTIGNNTSFNVGCIVVSKNEVKIGSNVSFGPNVVIYDHNHIMGNDHGVKNTGYINKSVLIGDNTWIGAGVIILPGARIGKNCVIAAGSVVTCTVPDRTVLIQKRESHYKMVDKCDE